MRNRDSSAEYSQNHLHSHRLVRRLLEKSSIEPGDLVYDIGAGRGIISEELARRGAKVVAIEKDRKLHSRLKHRLGGNPLIDIRLADILKHRLPSHGTYKVFANIPFLVTADIVRKLLCRSNPPQDCYLIVQKEAAQRFHGTPCKTLFSILLEPWFEFSLLHSFRRTDFAPSPGVDVVLMRMRKRGPPLLASEHAGPYRNLVIYAFRQGSPSLKKALDGILTDTQFRRLSRELGFGLQARPTDLDVQQWLGLFRFTSTEVDEDRRRLTLDAQERLRRQQSRRKKHRRTIRCVQRVTP